MSLFRTYKTDVPRIILYASVELAQGILNNKVFVFTSALVGDTTYYRRNYALFNRVNLWQWDVAKYLQ